MRVDALDRDNQTLLAHGTVLTLDNQIDPTTGTVKVKATFANQDNRLFPNEFVNARLLVRTLNNVNLVPTAAIQRNNDIAYVYVVNADQTAHSRNVKIATTDGDTAAVTGVNPGESLVIDGFDRLQEGSKVTIRKPATPSGRGPGGTPSADNGGETPAASDQSQPGPGRAK